jgi:hypothetical protein
VPYNILGLKLNNYFIFYEKGWHETVKNGIGLDMEEGNLYEE